MKREYYGGIYVEFSLVSSLVSPLHQPSKVTETVPPCTL